VEQTLERVVVSKSILYLVSFHLGALSKVYECNVCLRFCPVTNWARLPSQAAGREHRWKVKLVLKALDFALITCANTG